MPIPTPHTLPRVAPPSKAPRRVKPWMILVGISIGWKIVVLTLGAAVPRWVIGDGLDLVPFASRAYAQQAKMTALTLWDHPLERLGIVQALRVIRVDSAVAPSAGRGGTPAARSAAGARGSTASCNGRTATVRAYTYFAIPYSEARTVCDTGVVEYRVFRRRS